MHIFILFIFQACERWTVLKSLYSGEASDDDGDVTAENLLRTIAANGEKVYQNHKVRVDRVAQDALWASTGAVISLSDIRKSKIFSQLQQLLTANERKYPIEWIEDQMYVQFQKWES